MAHTIGTIPARSTVQTGNPITFSQQVLAGETLMVLMLKVVGGTDRTGGAPTWGNKTFTQANTTQKAAASPEAGCELWYIVNPLEPNPSTSQTSTLTIPNTGGLSIYYQVAMAVAGGGKGSEFGSANGSNGTSTNPTPGALTCEAGDVVFAINANGATTWAPSAQAGTAISNNDDGAHGGGTQYSLRASAGAFTANWTFGTSDDWGAVVATFRERSAPSANTYTSMRSTTGSVRP